MNRILTLTFSIMLVVPSTMGQATAQKESRVEENVIYGMYSGLALLMDIYHPPKPNGYGVIFIGGNSWNAPLQYAASPLKSSPQVSMYSKPLLEAGYTVFAINHRAAPRFRYPAAVEDDQRAVRFIRYYAKRYGIRPERIGAAGGSSGGHLVSLLGVLDGKGDAHDPDSINRESAKVQCVVARAAPADFINALPRANYTNFMGMLNSDPGSMEYKTYQEASPLYHVTKDDPPFLLLHGDADTIVSFKNSELMQQALKQAGVAVKLVRIVGGGHGPDFPGAKNPPNDLTEMILWFDQYLRGK